MLLPSSEALSNGNCRKATAEAAVINGSQVSENPWLAWNWPLNRSRSFATLVISTRWMVVTCAEVRLESSMCSAILIRMVLSGSIFVLAPGEKAGGGAAAGLLATGGAATGTAGAAAAGPGAAGVPCAM